MGVQQLEEMRQRASSLKLVEDCHFSWDGREYTATAAFTKDNIPHLVSHTALSSKDAFDGMCSKIIQAIGEV
jgi:hypothetical protein